MSNLIQIKVAELNQLNPLMIAEDNRVEQKFIQMYNAIWGTAQGAQIYEKEKCNAAFRWSATTCSHCPCHCE